MWKPNHSQQHDTADNQLPRRDPPFYRLTRKNLKVNKLSMPLFEVPNMLLNNTVFFHRSD